MYNRYQGNSGKVVRVDDSPREPHVAAPAGSIPVSAPRPVQQPISKPAGGGFLQGLNLSSLLPKGLGDLESEDIILLLILYLMYKDSGDSDLLIIMGAMFLL